MQTAMFDILKRIQSDVSEVKADVGALKRSVAGLEKTSTHLDARLELVERIVTQQRRYNAGMLVMMRATAGAFDERMLVMEEEMRQLKEPRR